MILEHECGLQLSLRTVKWPIKEYLIFQFSLNKCRNSLNQLLVNSSACLSFTACKMHSSDALMSTLLHGYDTQNNSTTVGHGQEIYI